MRQSCLDRFSQSRPHHRNSTVNVCARFSTVNVIRFCSLSFRGQNSLTLLVLFFFA
jgi:hypothetical protein